jgi:LPS-assembly lipoprotein
MNKIKFFLITITLLFFSSCGYKPIYSSTNKNNEKLLYVSVKSIKDRPGQILRNNLSKQLNPQNKKAIPKYYLFVEFNENKEELGYRKDMSATRTNLVINVSYNLKNINDGETILKGSTKVISSYDVVESIYATIIAEKDARIKGLKIISDTIVNELAIYFNNIKNK